MRSGRNQIDFRFSADTLGIDFDDGTAPHSFRGSLGLGGDETLFAPGDSGGPMFLSGDLLGVGSFALCLSIDNVLCNTPPDVDTVRNSSFGEIAGYTDVVQHRQWIDSVVAQAIPVPSPLLLLAVGIVLALRRRARNRWRRPTGNARP
jgi:hypothetical protein